jgi:multidrug efflux pump subunit AcrA (membrane-fusion protein)
MTAMKQRLFVLIAAFAPLIALAHEGHVHGPGETDAVQTGPVVLTDEAIKNLGVQTVEAGVAPLQRTIGMIGRIEGLPERLAKIAPRAEGRVAEILVKLGDRVTAGQPVLRFEPRTVGNPPVLLNAPIAGFVVRQEASLGQALNPDTVLMEVADYSHVLARGMTFESPDLSLIKPGQNATVQLDVFRARTFYGKVQRLDVGLERESRTFEVYVLLDNPELQLRPNMQASVSIAVGDPQEVLAVPQRAVLGDMGNLFVFVRDGNSFERRNIVVGMKAGDQVEIVEGVLPGDLVVTEGHYQLQFATTTAKTAAADDEHGPKGHSHDEGAKGVLAGKHLPGWAWGVGGLVLGALIMALMRNRSSEAAA